MDIQDRLNSLNAEIEKHSREQARAEVERAQALKAKQETLEALSEEFGVSTIEEAETLLKKLQKKLSKDIETLEGMVRELNS
jgi:hypothetical protein